MAENYFSKFLYCFLILFSLICVNLAEEICMSTSTCLCNMNDDKYIDISNITTNGQNYLTADKNELTYYFSGCKEFSIPNDQFPNATNNCKDTTFCTYDRKKNITYGVGKTQGTFVTSDDKIDFLIVSKQTATNQRPIIITLGCTNLQKSFLFPLPPSSTYNLILFSPHSCVLQHHRGLSTGSVLLIIFFVCLTVYLVSGALVLHFLRGARGKEMIPNYEFWTGLPLLVRDGFIFLLNGCKPISLPTAESYDRI